MKSNQKEMKEKGKRYTIPTQQEKRRRIIAFPTPRGKGSGKNSKKSGFGSRRVRVCVVFFVVVKMCRVLA